MSLQKKLVALGVGVSVLAVALLVFVGWFESGKFGATAKEEGSMLADADQEHIATGISALVESQRDLLAKTVGTQMRVFTQMLRKKGAVTFGEPEKWKAVNQFTKEATEVSLPRVFIGGEWLQHNSAFEQATPLVDDVTAVIDGPCTFFQRINEQGDMLRVATTVKAKDGKRGVSTFVPAINPDGKPNAVVASMLAKKPFSGAGFVVDAWYQTCYEPVLDANGRVAGMLFTGQKQESVASLRNAIQTAKVGKSGFATIYGGSGDKQGQVMISHDGKRDGEKVYEEKDADGKSYVKEIVDKAVQLKPGEIGEVVYRVNDGGRKENVEAHFMYFKPWDWVIVVNGFERDFIAFDRQIESGRSGMISRLLVTGLVLAGLVGIAFSLFAKKIARAIKQMVDAADAIAEGDLAVKIDNASNDEIGKLADAFRRMQNYLREVAAAAGKMADGDLGVELSARSAKDVLGTAISGMVENLRSLVGQVAAKAKTTASTSDRLSSASHEVATMSDDMAGAMRQVMQGVREAAMSSEEIAQGNSKLATIATEASSSMEELEGAIHNVREGSVQQQAATEQASETAAEGGKAVEEAIASMDRIQEKVVSSSNAVKELGAKQEQIGSIVVAIGEIAEQTNLLALNAAIEAARAGDQGRGFAVVADEVRKLAERSASATQEIRELIETIRTDVSKAMRVMDESLTEVSDGARHSAAARESLSGIVASVETVSELAKANDKTVQAAVATARNVSEAIRAVAATSEETAAGAEELGATSQQMSASTEQVSRSVEEQARTIQGVSGMAEELQAQAGDLMQMVAKFRVDDDEPLRRAA